MVELIRMFSYPFVLNALIVGSMVSLCASLLGTSLVLKRYSMIGEGLAHMGFVALATAHILNLAPLAVSLPVCVVTAFVLLQMQDRGTAGDAAIAVLCSASLAAGVIAVSVTSGMNVDVYNYMFGSILAMSSGDVVFSVILCSVVLVMYVLFYHRIFALTFDESFSQASGVHVRRYSMVLALLSSMTIVLGMRMMGALLISSLLVFPPLIAMRLCHSFLSTVITAAAVSLFCFFTGLVASYFLAAPTGASVVMVNTVVFAGAVIFQKIRESR